MDIAVEHGVTENAIFHWLVRHAIPRRTMSEARAVKHWGVAGEANPMYGKMGAANPNYIDGSSPERQRTYAQAAGRAFIRSVFARDGYRCRRCGSGKTGAKGLHAHHVAPWAGNEAVRLDLNNVVTLCRPCHHWVHSKANVAREWLV